MKQILVYLLSIVLSSCAYKINPNDPYYVPTVEYKHYEPRKEILIITPADLYPEEEKIVKQNLNKIVFEFCGDQKPKILSEERLYSKQTITSGGSYSYGSGNALQNYNNLNLSGSRSTSSKTIQSENAVYQGTQFLYICE